jgi:hypothetical protein
MPRPAYPVLDPEFVSLADASRLLCLGKTKLHEPISTKQLETLKVGKKRLVRLRSIRNFDAAA